MIDSRTDREIADEMQAAGVPMMDELNLVRMQGARSGLIHGLLHLRNAIATHSPDATYREIPAHHTRKRRDAQRIVDVLKAVEARLDEQQQGCARRLRVEALRKDQS